MNCLIEFYQDVIVCHQGTIDLFNDSFLTKDVNGFNFVIVCMCSILLGAIFS